MMKHQTLTEWFSAPFWRRMAEIYLFGGPAKNPMLGFKSFDAARSTLVGIELMHMLKKRQLVAEEGHEGLTVAERFYALAV
jgi:hypothetical protein